MSFVKRTTASLLASAALLAAGAAQADTTWAWSYSGDGVTASGTFVTAGNAANNPEDILSFTGTHNGMAILGLVPVGDPLGSNFVWDNQFSASYPHFSEGGLLFNVGGGDAGIINLYYWADDDAIYNLIVVDGEPIEVPVAFSASIVPEPATYGYMALGLVGLAVAARRRKAA
jgi:hypothetical protein